MGIDTDECFRNRKVILFLAVLVLSGLAVITAAPGSSFAENTMPRASFTVSNQTMEKDYFNTDETIFFNANASFDGDGDPLIYTWDFGDGSESIPTNRTSTSHIYENPNRYTVTLSVSDQMESDSFSLTINVSDEQPVVNILSPENDKDIKINTPVLFEAAPHYIVNRLVLYEWDFDNDSITDVFSPERKIYHTFTKITGKDGLRISCKLSGHDGDLSPQSTSIRIIVTFKGNNSLQFLSPPHDSEFDIDEKIDFSVTWHGQEHESIFYEWDFDGDDVVDKITCKNHTTYSYNKSHSGKSYVASVRIANTPDIDFEHAYLNIKITEKDDFGEMLSDTAVIVVLSLCGFIIVVGFFGSWALKKFGLPEVLSLVALGVFLVPIGNLMDPEPLLRVSSIFGSLALMIILFDGGLDLNLQKVRDESSRALLLAIVAFALTVMAVGLFTGFMFFDNKWSVGILFGAVIGGTSGSIVLPLISKLRVTESTKTLVSIESTLTDVFCIVMVLAIANYISPGNGAAEAASGVEQAVSTFFSAFAIGIVSGLILGLIWINMLKRLEDFQYSFMLTIAVVFLLFAFNEFAGGSGPVSVLIFGVILANGKEIGSMLRIRNVSEVSKSMKDFHSQLSFIIRTFFFVFLGIIVSKSLFSWDGVETWVYGLAFMAIIFATRWLAVHIVIRKGDALKDKKLLAILLPRGLAAAVLAMVPITYHFLDNDIMNSDQIRFFFDSAFVVIIFSVLFTTIGVPLWQRGKKKRGFFEGILDEEARKNEKASQGKKKTQPSKNEKTSGGGPMADKKKRGAKGARAGKNRKKSSGEKKKKKKRDLTVSQRRGKGPKTKDFGKKRRSPGRGSQKKGDGSKKKSNENNSRETRGRNGSRRKRRESKGERKGVEASSDIPSDISSETISSPELMKTPEILADSLEPPEKEPEVHGSQEIFPTWEKDDDHLQDDGHAYAKRILNTIIEREFTQRSYKKETISSSPGTIMDENEEYPFDLPPPKEEDVDLLDLLAPNL